VLTVACVLWVGDFRKTEYRPEHVERLEAMVRDHLDEPYRFVCLTNVPEKVSCETIPLVTDWPGWWAKLELFRPDLFDDRVLYLDLDVDVIGDLSDLVNFDAPFASIKDWQNGGYNSSVMVWTPQERTNRLYQTFSMNKNFPGDQDWISASMWPKVYFPAPWCLSYKRHIRFLRQKLTLENRVIVYHGDPKPWDIDD